MLRRPLLVAALLALLAFGAQQLSGASPGVRNGRIAYAHVGNGNRLQIYTVSSTGAHRRQLTKSTRYSSFGPAYAPRGKRIVFVRSFKQQDLWTVNANGTHERPLTTTATIDESDPAWSPDGKELAFSVQKPTAQYGIWVMGVDGQNRHRLTTGEDDSPSWSPDGTEIAFSRMTSSPSTGPIEQIYVVAASGSGPPVDLTNDLSVDDLSPSWSPDGSRILFSSDRPSAENATQLDLWTMNSDGSNVHRVTNTPSRDEHNPAWSPDGRRIVYSANGSFHGASSSQLYVSKADGTKRRILTHACGECAFINDDPSWQPLPG
jgi:Tol biopolymer transport system component